MMIKISTPTKEQELYELAQEAPYPMTKRALDALKNGKQDEAMQILEEHLKNLADEQEVELWKYLRELMELVTLWLYKPEKEGTWLTRIDKIREEILIIACQQNRFDENYFRKQIAEEWETVKELVRIEIPHADFFLPSFEAIFITEHDWRVVNLQSHE